jgi:hypothetical protein
MSKKNLITLPKSLFHDESKKIHQHKPRRPITGRTTTNSFNTKRNNAANTAPRKQSGELLQIRKKPSSGSSDIEDFIYDNSPEIPPL